MKNAKILSAEGIFYRFSYVLAFNDYGAVDVVSGELDSMDALEDQLQAGLLDLENDWPRVQSIVSWNWIVNALLN